MTPEERAREVLLGMALRCTMPEQQEQLLIDAIAQARAEAIEEAAALMDREAREMNNPDLLMFSSMIRSLPGAQT